MDREKGLNLLAVDHIALISVYLAAEDLGRLWLCGNQRLKMVLSAGGAHTFDHTLYRPPPLLSRWPTLVCHLSNIKHFILHRMGKLSGRLRLEVLPKTLKSLDLNFAGCLEAMQRYVNVHFKKYSPESQLSALFPELETLKLAYSPSQAPHTPECLPPSLTHIEFWSQHLTPALIARLPRLQIVRNSELSYSPDWSGFESLKLLSTLHLRNLSSSLDLACLGRMPSITSLLLQPTYILPPEWHWIPSSLFHLELALPNPNVDNLLSVLPKRLTSLIISKSGQWSAENIAQALFPPSLRTLVLNSSHRVKGLNLPAHVDLPTFIASIPRSLTVLSIHLTSKSSSLGTNELTALPRTLTRIGEKISEHADLSALPSSLTELQFPNDTEIDLETIGDLPRSLTSLVLPKPATSDPDVTQAVLALPQLRSVSNLDITTLARPEDMRRQTLKITIPSRFRSLTFGSPSQHHIEIKFEDDRSSINTAAEPTSLAELAPSSSLAKFILECTNHSVPKILVIDGFAPRSLTEVRIKEASLDAGIIGAFEYCSNLFTLSLATFSNQLSDEDFALLPRRINSIFIIGARTTKITTKLFAMLPMHLCSLSLPQCPSLDKEYEKYKDEAGAMKLLPTMLSELIFRGTRNEIRDSAWTRATKLKPRN